MMKHLQPFFAFCLVLSVWFITTPSTGYACSCVIPPPPDEALQKANAVFAGKVISIKQDRQKKSVWFEVEETWKGVHATQVEVTTALDSAACGFEFIEGQQYLVYANQGESDQLATNLCTRTAELASAKEDLAVLGEGKAPTDEVKLEDNSKRANAYVWAFAVAAAGMAAFIFWKRVRS